MNNNEEFISKCDCGEEFYNLLSLDEHKVNKYVDH